MGATYQIEQPDGSVYQVEVPETQTASPPNPMAKALEVAGNIHIAPLGPALKEYPRIAMNTASAATGGLIPYGAFPSLPPVSSTRGHITDFLAQGYGLTQGLPGKVAAGVTGQVATRLPELLASPLGRAALRGVSGASTGALSDVRQPAQMPARAGIGAAATIAIPPLVDKAFQKVGAKMLSDPQMEAFAQKVRQAFFGAHTAEGIQFDSAINHQVTKNPSQVVPIDDLVNSVAEQAKTDKAFAEKLYQGLLRSAKQQNMTLANYLKDPTAAATATARDVQNVKQTLQSVPSTSRALNALSAKPYQPGRFDAKVSDTDLGILEHLKELRGRLLGAYPDLADDYQRYSTFMQDYRTVQPRFRANSLETTLLKGMGSSEQRQAMNRVLPSEILNEIESVRLNHQRALNEIEKNRNFHRLLRKLGYRAALWGAGGAAAGLGFRAVRNFSE